MNDENRRRRSQAERRQATRNKLIASAIECICEAGYANITTSEIAKRAGVSRGALQHHFAKRIDMLVAVIDHLSSEMLHLTQDLPAHGLSIEDRVSAVVHQYWTIFTSPTFLAVLNIFLGAQNDPQMYGALRTHMTRLYQANDGLWRSIFFDVDLPEERLVTIRRILLASLRGLGVAQIMGLQPKPARREIELLEKILVSQLTAS